MHKQEVDQLVGHLFRQEAGRMAAVLTRLFGFEHLEQSEDIVQDTLLTALSVWKIKGVPDNPSAWLHTVAKRKAIDVIRSRKVHAKIHSKLAQALQSEWTFTPAINQLFLENEIEDSQLRMIFACCHPAIPYDSQIALTLKTLCGLSVAEITKAFLTTEETITKRLYRAREKIRVEKIDLEVPLAAEMPGRLEAVLHTLYLFFNEGYNSSHAEHLIRQDLCEEAIRLCLLLTRNKITNTPKANALLALMCFQASRQEARLTASGEIILLKYQDRNLWNKKLIEKAMLYLNIATQDDSLSEYHIEAVIGAYHATADRFETTDWVSIHNLYEALAKIKPGPVVEMNKAIALGYSVSPKSGLVALLKIEGLEESHLYYAALGDFYMETGDRKNSLAAYEKAINLATSGQEKELLIKKMEMLL
jgi:RNA polymerase sigma-70 factor (ECF subfamily)